MSDVPPPSLSSFFPVVTGIIPVRRARTVPAKLGESTFDVRDKPWEVMEEEMITYFREKGLGYVPSRSTYAVTVTSAPNDSSLQIDFIAYLREDGSYVVDSKRWSGDIFTALGSFCDLKAILRNEPLPNNERWYDNEENDLENHNLPHDFDSLLN